VRARALHRHAPRSRAHLVAAALLVLSPLAARASEADAFEDRVKPVSGQLYTKAGKLELTVPAGTISLNDAFFTKYMVGAKLGYHLSESFSIAATGSYAFTSPTGSTSVCRANQGCREALNSELYQVPGRINWIAGAELAFSPVYGKLNLFAEKAIHFDLSIMAGPDFVSYRDVVSAADANAGVVPGNATSIGGHLGIGARIFFARFMALQLEVKDVLYSVPHLATGKLQTQLLANVGLSFFIPVTRGNAP
jgi:outer membrane beta-barrel protein